MPVGCSLQPLFLAQLDIPSHRDLSSRTIQEGRMKRSMICLFSAAIVILVSFQFPGTQAQSKIFITPDGSTPTGLFAPGVLVGKTLYVSGKGDYKPEEGIPGKNRKCLTDVRNDLK